MRLIHTSDWHLGQTLHDFDRTYEHRSFLDWLCGILEQEQPDALLICGDVFDNANPSAASLQLFYRFLRDATTRVPGLQILTIAGNHDSPGRLEAPAPLLEAMAVTVVGRVTRNDDGELDLDRLLVPLRDHGGAIRAWCLAVPYLRPGDATAHDEPSGYTADVTRLYQNLLSRAAARREPGQALIAMGHLHMAGGAVSEDSERRILIGGAEAIPLDAFAGPLAYAALGHLHRAQTVGPGDHIRYSGSPLPLSFKEVDYPHQVIRIDLDGEHASEIHALSVPRAVDLLRIPAQADRIDAVLSELGRLGLPPRPIAAQPYLEVRVLLDQPEPGLRARIEGVLAEQPVRLAKIVTSYPAAGTHQQTDTSLSLDELGQIDPRSIFQRLYARQYHCDPPETLLRAFDEISVAAPREPAR